MLPVLLLLQLLLRPAAVALPNYQGCVTPEAAALPYCNDALGMDERIGDLLDRLTLEEQINLISTGNHSVSCNMPSSPVPRVGLPEYTWLMETNTGVHAVCLETGQCPTIFPDPMAVGASFNRTLWFAKGDVISTEMRALSNSGGIIDKGPDLPTGLTGFGPNINIARDPRSGRNNELPGEDPFHLGAYAAEYVKGMQQRDERGIYKMNAYLKHFTAYSMEFQRQHSDASVSAFDLFDTYLPQYEKAFREANASGVMCSYNGINGVPNCASGFLTDLMRNQWGQKDALTYSDCGAVQDLIQGYPWERYNGSSVAAVSAAIRNGTDIEAGSTLYNSSAVEAVKAGQLDAAEVRSAARRSLVQRFKVGLFDDPAKVKWTHIEASALGSEEHQSVSYHAALQGIVLLRNDGILPLKKGVKVAVIGPHANTRKELFSDYYGNEVCFNSTHPEDKDFSCVRSITEAIESVNQAGSTVGVSVPKFVGGDDGGMGDAVSAAEDADVIVLAVGLEAFKPDLEHESYDRDSITLPGLQTEMITYMLRMRKPTIMVMINGGPIAIDTILNLPEDLQPKAIVEAFYPGPHGATAIAASIFGDENRWGKLPMTIYPAQYTASIPLDEYSMSVAPGRTHRYYTGKPLFPFGFGLSLTTFDSKCEPAKSNELKYSCTVKNTGDRDGDEVLFMYTKPSPELRAHLSTRHPVPLRQLCGFERIFVKAGSSEVVDFECSDEERFALTNESGERVVWRNYDHIVEFSDTEQSSYSISL